MKNLLPIFILIGLLITGCATVSHKGIASPAASSETVLVTYHVQKGHEAEFEKLLWQAWGVYRHDRLVFPKPHIVLHDRENGKPRYVEIFTWVDRSVPENAPTNVMALWKQEQALCERRDGHEAIEPGEVHFVEP